MTRNIKKDRHVWLPLLLLIYAGFMAWQGRDILLVQHDYLRYFGTIVAEVIIILLLAVFLKRRMKLKQQREENM